MKKLLIALIALVSLSASADAQTTAPTERQHIKTDRKRDAVKHHRHRKFKRHHRRHNIAQQLNFSDAQKSQAKLYREEYKKQLQDLNKNENITVKESRDRKAAIHKEQAAKMQALLTSEQKDKMAQLRSDAKAKGQQHATARMDKMKTKLDLSDKQVAQLKTQRETMRSKFKAIKEDQTLDRTAKKEKLMALKTQMKEDNKKIFTEEQLKKMEDMKKERMDKKAVK